MDGEEEVERDDAPVEEEPVVDEPATPDPPPTNGETPWSKDLEAAFEDAQTRGQVDAFLRENVQPYVTQIEQATQVNRDAERLWNDFTSEPVDTFRAVATELFGEDVAGKLSDVITNPDDTEEDTVTEEPEFKIDDDELPEHVREAVEYVQNERQQREWDAELSRLREANSDINIIEDLFYPFVSAADGDTEEAVKAYREFATKAKETFDIPDDIKLSNEPPPVVGDGKDGSGTAPPVKEKMTLDEAMDEFLAEQRGSAPPV